MNKKLIAVAVAGIVAAPAAYADISAYGRINNRIVIADNDDIDMQTSGSRFRLQGLRRYGERDERFRPV